MCSLLHFRLEEVALNLYEELFQRWGYNVAFLSAHREATVELITVFLWRHQNWSYIRPHLSIQTFVLKFPSIQTAHQYFSGMRKLHSKGVVVYISTGF